MSNVSTFAGSPSNKDATGTAARFNQPFGMVKVGAYLYVTDTVNQTIRKVDVATGVVTTLAGSAGVPGNNDGIGTAASFRTPMGIASDGTNLYVSDSDNNTIRQIVIATGEVTTFAGTAPAHGNGDGVGSDVSFNRPIGLTILGGFLYVADSNNSTIRAVLLTGSGRGTTDTFAGLAGTTGHNDGGFGIATFNNPWGITTDGTNLFVADTLNHTIRKIVVATKVVSTLAGTAGAQGNTDAIGTAARFDNPWTLASDGSYLFVGDPNNQEIRKVDIATGGVSSLAGSSTQTEGFRNGVGAAALFWAPASLVVDGSTLFTADMLNNMIRKVDVPTTTVSTFAGTLPSADGNGSAAGFSTPRYITTDGINLFIVDDFIGSIRKVVISTGEVSTLLLFGGCLDITTDGTHLFYITYDYTVHTILIASGDDTFLAGSSGVQSSVDGVGAAAGFLNPVRITTDGTSLYIIDNNAVRKIVIATGAVSTLAGTADVAGSADGIGAVAAFTTPQGITTDGTNLYVSDSGNNMIRQVVIATGAVTTLAGNTVSGNSDGIGNNASFNNPMGITTDGSNLYVTDTGNNEIRQINIASGNVFTSAGTTTAGSADLGMARFNNPQGITTDGISLFVTDTNNSTIRKLDHMLQ